MNFKKSALASAAALSLAAAGSANANIGFESNGWEFGASGYIPVFAGVFDGDVDDNSDFRVGSGFNPASLNLMFSAPTQNGLDVSGHFQVNNHVGEGGNNFDGFGSRVAKLDVAGDFGTLSFGQMLGVFGVGGLGDAGSAMGVGIGNPSGAATAGRISVGTFYTDFYPQIQYTSNRAGGVQFQVAVVQPTASGTISADDFVFEDDIPGGDTETPRLELGLNYASDVFNAWVSGGIQNVTDAPVLDATGAAVDRDDATVTGVEIGASASFGPANVRANFNQTDGAGPGLWGGGAAVGAEAEYQQYYVEGTFDAGIHTFGASYGGGSYDGADDDELLMVFSRHRATDALTFMVELQDYSAEGGGSLGGGQDYNALYVGSQYNF